MLMSAPRRPALLTVIGILLGLGVMLFSAGTVLAESSPKVLASPADPEGNKACLECHSKPGTMNRGGKELSIHVESKSFNDSVHGIISCARCHAEVGPEHAKDPKKPLNVPTGRELVALKSEGCVKCHAGVYEQSYKLSFHGVAVEHGDLRAATCVDCHGVHNVLPSRNPASTVSQGNLAKTCGTAECHPGAPENFAKGKEHIIPATGEGSKELSLLFKAFMALILFDTLKDGPIVMFELLRRLQS